MTKTLERDPSTCANPALIFHEEHLARQRRLKMAIAIHHAKRRPEPEQKPGLPKVSEPNALIAKMAVSEQSQACEPCEIAAPPDGLFWHLAHPATPEHGAPIRSGRQIFVGIVARVCVKYGIVENELMAHRRNIEMVQARSEIYWLSRNNTRLSFPEIARLMDGRDHTTIIHGVTRYEEMRKFVSEFGVDAKNGRWDLTKIITGDATCA